MSDNFDFKKFLAENKLGAYSKAGKLNEGINDHLDEAEIDDKIYGRGDDDDFDRRRDASLSGVEYVPHEPRVPRPSNFVTPTSQAKGIEKLVNKMIMLNRVAIDKYKYAKKDQKPAAKEALMKTIKYMLGDSYGRYADEVMKGIEKAKGIWTPKQP